MRIALILRSFSVIVALFLAGCQTTVTVDGDKDITPSRRFLDLLPNDTHAVLPKETRYKIGVLLPLSGKDQKLGEGFYNAAKLALFSQKKHSVSLVPLDTKGTPEGAVIAMEKGVAAKVDAVIGPIRANEVQAIHYIARQNRIPVIAFTNDIRARAKGILVFGFDVHEQVTQVFSYAHKKGIESVAAILPKDAYGSRNQQALERAKRDGLIKDIDFYYYTPRGQKFIKELSHLKDKTYDAFYIPEGGSRIKTIISSLLFHHVNMHAVQLIGVGQWLDDDLKSLQSLNRGWFTAPPANGFNLFQDLYFRQYKHTPMRIYTLAFDAAQVLVQLSKKYKNDPFNLDYLTNKQGFLGIDGLFRFTPDGDTERGLAVYTFSEQDFRVISRAPQSFS